MDRVTRGRRWRSLRTKGLAVVVIPALALVAASVAVLVVDSKARATDREVAHATDVRVELQRILTLLVDGETGVRGYLVTGDATFLEPYEGLVRDLPAAVDVVRRLHRDSADDTTALRALVERELVLLEGLRRSRAQPPAQRMTLALEGKRALDEIRASIATIVTSHELEQRRYEASNDRLDSLARSITIALLVIGAVGGTAIAGVFLRSLVRRLAQVEDNARRLAAGQALHAPTGGADEIADVEASLHEAAALIAAQHSRLDLALEMGKITVFGIDDTGALRDARYGGGVQGVTSLAQAMQRVDPADRDAVLHSIDAIRGDGVSRDFELRRVDSGGWLAGRLTRMSSNGATGLVLGVVMDVSALKDAEAALRAMESDRAAAALAVSEERGRHNALLLASAGEGIYSIDTDGVCTSINPTAARLLGYEVSDLVGAKMHDRIHHSHPDGSPYPESECPTMRSVATGLGVRVEGDVLWRRDTTMLPVDYSSFPIVDDGVVRGAVVTFSDVTDREATQLELDTFAGELRRGIAGGEIVLHYQPKIDLATGRCEAVEALVRWQRGDTLVFPDDFIPAAERSGAIHELTTWVVSESVRQAATWQRAGRPLRVAVNLSATSLHDERVVAHLAAAADQAGIPASCIEIELTETTVAEDIESVLRNLAAFAAMGVRSAIDDFGTGFSSLSYLKQLPVTYLKIDKSFVMNMPRDTRDQAIVAATIHLAHSLGLRVVAEGVENDLVLRQLQHADCDLGQGYHWTRPLPAAQFEQWLDEHRAADGST
jgi:PAS domain S-box-containing protein